MSGEDIQGEVCQDCGKTHFICTCKRCVDCKLNYAPEDIDAEGFCVNCRADFETMDLKDKLSAWLKEQIVLAQPQDSDSELEVAIVKSALQTYERVLAYVEGGKL